MKKELKEKIQKVLKDNYIDQKDGEYVGFEIFCNYDDELGDTQLAEISKADNPRYAFESIMEEWRYDSEIDYYKPELFSKLRSEIEEYEDNESEIHDYIDEYVYWFMPEQHFNKTVNVVIALDTGDLNTDFTECNILNWYGLYGGYGDKTNPLSDNSPIKWLAKQQRKLTELKKALKTEIKQSDDFYGNATSYSKFTRSMIQELQNACSHMNTLVFLVSMPLFDFFKLKELVQSEKDKNISYDYQERTGTKSFYVTKKADCGLYDVWQGGGSLLEIELEKDVKIPTKAIWDVWIDCRGCNSNGKGYDISSVYGRMDAWKGEVRF